MRLCQENSLFGENYFSDFPENGSVARKPASIGSVDPETLMSSAFYSPSHAIDTPSKSIDTSSAANDTA